MTRTALVLAALALAALALASITGPSSALTLRQPVTAEGAVVRLGDFFADGGEHADVALFHAPAAGSSGTVSILRLEEAVQGLGIAWTPPPGIELVEVSRAGEPEPEQAAIDLATIESALRDALAGALPGVEGPDDVSLDLLGSPKPIALTGAEGPAIAVARIEVDPQRSRFAATIEVADGGRTLSREFTGRYETFAQIPVLTREIRRGEVIAIDDIEIQRMPVPGEAALRSRADIVGMAARRQLRAGNTLGATDVAPPNVVTKNQLVTMTFRMPGIVLTTQGRALADAAVGESVSVLNIRSNSVVQAIALGTGLVGVETAPTHMAMR